jgi:hypothetical protein
MHKHGGSVDLNTLSKIAGELGVSRDEVDVSVGNLAKVNFAGNLGAGVFTGQLGAGAYLIGLTPFGREFLRTISD